MLAQRLPHWPVIKTPLGSLWGRWGGGGDACVSDTVMGGGYKCVDLFVFIARYLPNGLENSRKDRFFINFFSSPPCSGSQTPYLLAPHKESWTSFIIILIPKKIHKPYPRALTCMHLYLKMLLVFENKCMYLYSNIKTNFKFLQIIQNRNYLIYSNPK